MAPTELTEYERKRLDNIRRKDEMMAALKIHSMATELTALTKRHSHVTKSDKVPQKKPRNDTRVVKRQSLRTGGMPPDSKGVRKRLRMKQAYCREGSDRALIETIVGIGKKSRVGISNEAESGTDGFCKDGSLGVSGNEVAGSFSLDEPIKALRFFPCDSSRIIVAGNRLGSVGFWNLDHVIEEEDGIYRYRPHQSSISGISIHPHCLTKGRARGGLKIWDARTGNCTTQWSLHDEKINSIDFSSENPNIMATSSRDWTACIWDLRRIDADKPKTLKTVRHEATISFAYFSSSGKCLATTGYSGTIGITGGANFEETSFISHSNPSYTQVPISGVWGWDDSHLFVSSSKKRIDVIFLAQRNTSFALESPYLESAPMRLDAHPHNVGMLAGDTSWGRIYVWSLN
ncbi:Guanine nucleotide-binding protein, beta subunit [Parasponia andersonii]|uniref:Guanine nucleotide-binding protein, beta subunit n=1 Tax=Parasponia andersonii TaxID=3476 RepID=A0A2P5CN90_PARAD|nr:Guanine nucleotide-binding protein, beta subunit [Parasponia andersonii]